MASSKAQLRAINDAIKGSKFDEAIEMARDFLSKDSKNYQAWANSSMPSNPAHR